MYYYLFISLLLIIQNIKFSNEYCFQLINGVPNYSKGTDCFFKINNEIINDGYGPIQYKKRNNFKFNSFPNKGKERKNNEFWDNFPFFGQQFIYNGDTNSNTEINGKTWTSSTHCSISCIGNICSQS
ncbi:hypothetical protein Mgra_00004635, partial [Meloidogyne graminicola]